MNMDELVMMLRTEKGRFNLSILIQERTGDSLLKTNESVDCIAKGLIILLGMSQ